MTCTPRLVMRVEVGGGGGDEGLALTGLHLGDVAEVQGCAAHELHVEVTEAERAAARLAHRGERLGQQVVERLAVRVALAQLDGLVLELLVGERVEVVFEGVDRRRVVLQPPEGAALADAEDLFQNRSHECSPVVVGRRVLRVERPGTLDLAVRTAIIAMLAGNDPGACEPAEACARDRLDGFASTQAVARCSAACASAGACSSSRASSRPIRP